MNLYLAPLEGITGHIYRNALHQCFDGFDKYFIPFISPNQKGHFSTREKKDVMPEHNQGMLPCRRSLQIMWKISYAQQRSLEIMDIRK